MTPTHPHTSAATPAGAAVRTCTRVDVVPSSPWNGSMPTRVEDQQPDSDRPSGPWAWLLADSRNLHAPDPATGRRWLWHYTCSQTPRPAGDTAGSRHPA